MYDSPAWYKVLVGFLANLSSKLRGRSPEDLSWFAVTGYGLELVLRRTVQVEHCINGHLRLERGDGGVVAIVPGVEVARETPTRIDTVGGGVSYCCGPRGPMLVPEYVEPLETTFHSIRTRNSQGWGLVGLGFEMTFPVGLAVVAERGASAPFVELHLAEDATVSSFIRFVRVSSRDIERVFDTPGAPDWTRTHRGQVECATGRRRWIEFAYRTETGHWHQRRYLLTVHEGLVFIAIAQARQDRASLLFAAGDDLARSFAPTSVQVADEHG